jgi:hypothetical protein
VSDPCPLDDLRVVEEQRVRELAEEADARAEEHRRQVDGDLVDQVEVERLLDDAGPGQGDGLAVCDRLGMPIPGQGTGISPLSYQSKRCPTLSSGSAMKPSTDIVSGAITLAMSNPTERVEPGL